LFQGEDVFGDDEFARLLNPPPVKKVDEGLLVSKDKISERPYIDAIVDSVPFRALVDTGADASLMDARTFKEHFGEHDLRASRAHIKAVQSHRSEVLGFVQIPMSVSGSKIRRKYFYIIENLGYPILLGIDAMQRFDITLRGKTGLLYVNLTEVQTWNWNRSTKEFEVRNKKGYASLDKPKKIKARSTTMLRLNVGPYYDDGCLMYMEPTTPFEDKEDCLIPSMLVTVKNGKVNVPVINTTKAKMTMPAGVNIMQVQTDVEVIENETEEQA
jgi:hypothetical protein